MKKFLSYLPLSAAALVALSFAACTDSDVVSDGSKTTGGSVNENAIMFSTYMGTAQNTRAQYAGDINTDILKDDAKANGFGVFAYYTGQDGNEHVNYTAFRKKGTGTVYPNFMYNQHVTYNANSGSDITQWEYTPIKYWPNEVSNNATKGVDDQVNNKDNDPATTTMEYGGQVSFFAYAPYVEVSQTTATNIDGAKPTAGNECTTEGTSPSPVRKSGIIALSGNQYVGSSTDPEYYSDPYVYFGLPISKNSKYVDLLWGTKGGTNQDVNNEGNTGVKGTGETGTTTATDYATALLKDYWTNADLRKQTTTGKIEFLFKHALSKVGGSYQGDGEGDDEDPKTATNGLMIVLDLDNEGEETGGKLEPFDPALNAKTKYKTKVTVKDIQIAARMLTKDNTNKTPGTEEYANTWYTTNEGYFNLATGQWDLPTTINNTTTDVNNALTINHNIKSPASTLTDYSGTLSEEIAEPASVAAGADAFANTLPIGVTTVKKNVYEEATNALVFFPGTYPELTITIDYIVRTYDPNLAKGYSDVGQKITKKLTFTSVAELNKMYNILIHLGLTSVKFTAEVSDWDVNSTTTTTINDEGEAVEIEEVLVDHDVYEPINVKNTVTALAVAATAGDNTGTLSNAVATPIIATSNAASTSTLTVTATYTTPTGNNTANVTQNVSYTSDASWVTVDAGGNVKIAENTANSKQGREATITIKYGEVTQEIKVQQYSKFVETLTIAADPDIALKSAGGTLEIDKNCTVTAQTALYYDNAKKYMSTNETVTDKAAFSVENGTGTAAMTDPTILDDKKTLRYGNNISGNDHTVTIKAKYMGVTTATGITATQVSGELKEIKTNLGSAQNISYTAGNTLTVTKVTATFDDNGAGTGTFDVDVTSAATGEFTADGTNPIVGGDWNASTKTLTVANANNSTTTDLTGTLTVTYTPATNAGTAKASAITVTQSKKQ